MFSVPVLAPVPRFRFGPSSALRRFVFGVGSVDEKQIRKHFEEFFEDVFSEMMNFGEIQEMCVAGNLGDHLIGNTCELSPAAAAAPGEPMAAVDVCSRGLTLGTATADIQFHREEDAEKALQALAGRFYAGRPLMVEFSPGTRTPPAYTPPMWLPRRQDCCVQPQCLIDTVVCSDGLP